MTTRYVRSPSVLWRRCLDRVLTRPLDRAETVTLAGTGVDLWEVLHEPRSVDDVVAVLAARYGVAARVVRADVVPAIEELVIRGVLIVDSEPDGGA